ncbi:MAG TPA: hypothetical protein VMU07_02180, partial [Candidatus Paceibacterota bacterium]|nr:hypothetical protein [Candidatus Paceibacterota bacterium]
MRKSELLKYPIGTPEYVVLHARYQQSRGRKPSATLLDCWRNPREALAMAKRLAYFPATGIYLNGEIPKDYKCGNCGATNCKLWREYQTCNPQLLCALCAAIDQKKDISTIDSNGCRLDDGMRSDQIGWYVPAVPTEDSHTYWGYTSVPGPGCRWWQGLPSLPPTNSPVY